MDICEHAVSIFGLQQSCSLVYVAKFCSHTINPRAATLRLKGIELVQSVGETKKRTLGDEHIDTLSGMKILSFMLDEVNMNKAAVELLDGTLDKMRKTLGNEHRETSHAAIELKLLRRNFRDTSRSSDEADEAGEAGEAELVPEESIQKTLEDGKLVPRVENQETIAMATSSEQDIIYHLAQLMELLEMFKIWKDAAQDLRAASFSSLIRTLRLSLGLLLQGDNLDEFGKVTKELGLESKFNTFDDLLNGFEGLDSNTYE